MRDRYFMHQHRWNIFHTRCEVCSITYKEIVNAPSSQRDDFLDCDWCKQWKEYREELRIKHQEFEESLAWL